MHAKPTTTTTTNSVSFVFEWLFTCLSLSLNIDFCCSRFCSMQIANKIRCQRVCVRLSMTVGVLLHIFTLRANAADVGIFRRNIYSRTLAEWCWRGVCACVSICLFRYRNAMNRGLGTNASVCVIFLFANSYDFNIYYSFGRCFIVHTSKYTLTLAQNPTES